MCLGLHFAEMQVRAVLLSLLRDWRWIVPDDYEAKYSYAPIAKPRDQLPLQLAPVVSGTFVFGVSPRNV